MVTPDPILIAVSVLMGVCVTCTRDVDALDPTDEANFAATGECPDCIAAKAGEDDE